MLGKQESGLSPHPTPSSEKCDKVGVFWGTCWERGGVGHSCMTHDRLSSDDSRKSNLFAFSQNICSNNMLWGYTYECHNMH